MNGITGSYQVWNENTERTLRLASWKPNTGECVINAYLGERYIGVFEGTIGGIDDYPTYYSGVFTSVNGTKLDFGMSDEPAD